MPLVLSERIDDQSVDRLQTLGLLPHMARLCAVARHPVEPKSALFFGWPELGTFADENATGPWFARHPWQTLLTVLHGVARGLCALHGAGEAHGAVTPAAVGVRHDGGAWLLPCGSLHVRPASGSATLGEKALACDADLRGLGRLLHELGSAGASAPPAVSVALLELAPKCEALELTMHEVASKLADVLRMSVLDSSVAPAEGDLPPATQDSSAAPAEGDLPPATQDSSAAPAEGDLPPATQDSSAAPAVADLPPATQRWSRLRVLLTAASAFTEAAAKRALCLICLEEVSTRRGLACPEGHLICSECLQGYICSLAGSARLSSSNGALGCLGDHLQPFSFCRSMVEPLLFGDALRLYLETTETAETPGQEEVQCTPESIQPELHEALNLSCPSCGVFCDPDPLGCIAMKCSSCDVAFCWLCFQPCGSNAHPHCREVHGTYFPSRSDMNRWHRRLRWLQVDAVLQRSFGGRPPAPSSSGGAGSSTDPLPAPRRSPGATFPFVRVVGIDRGPPTEREEALRLCERNLADSAIGLWPFPTVVPSVGGMLGVAAHVQAAQFGRIDELRALLDETPELIDRANDRGMTALMAAAHGGHTAVVTMLLERGADVSCRDDRGVSALEFAIREDRQEVVLAILDHAGPEVNAVGPRGGTALLVACEFRREAIARALLDRGAKVDALKNRLDIESARMLAKIGTEKGIMLFGIKRDQKEANFRNQGLSPGDAILLATDLANSLLMECNVRGNNLDIESARMLAKIGTDKGIMLFGIKRDQKEANFRNQGLSPGDAILLATDLVTGTLTVANLLGNQLDVKSAKMLAEVAKKKGISLCGILRNQTTADFSNQCLGVVDAILLGSDLSQAIVTGALTELSIDGNHVGDKGVCAICEAIQSNKETKLASLDMSGNRIGQVGAKSVASMVAVTGGLTCLDLSNNSLCGETTFGGGTYTAEGITAIAEALRVNGGLTVANLLGNQLDVKSAKILLEVAKQKGISLCGIQRDQTTADFRKRLQPPEAILLASDLSQAIVTGALTSVELGGNKLKDEGCGPIFAAICGNKDSKIMFLDASKENIGPAGVKLIAEALRTNVTGSLTQVLAF
jgi:hypothetical protein